MIVRGGRAFYGEAIGIVMLNTTNPLIPGNVGNASTYNFPVRFNVIDVPTDWFFDKEGASERRREKFIQGAKQLEKEGVRAITASCGYFGVFQKVADDALRVPIFTSPLLLVPLISRMIGRTRKVGIVCARAEFLKGAFLRNVGIDESIPIAVAGMEEKEEFVRALNTGEKPTMDVERVEQEVVDVARKLVSDNPDVGAIVLECSDLPSFSAAIQEVVNLPIFDYITFINMVYAAVVQRRYEGFM